MLGKHPRLRGEDSVEEQNFAPPTETPPLTRGRPFDFAHLGFSLGNTPAYAGKTTSKYPQGTAVQKHPRLRGEDHLKIDKSELAEETPPLTRGRLDMSFLPFRSLGNTPAYAGKTEKIPSEKADLTETPPLTRGRPPTARCAPLGAEKHPRLRGEDSRPPQALRR